jgi:hypothetical protein
MIVITALKSRSIVVDSPSFDCDIAIDEVYRYFDRNINSTLVMLDV